MQSGVPIIDIRRAEEWSDTGVIKQSNLLTFFDKQGNHNIDKWLPELKKIVKEGDPVIIICRSGKRSGIVSKFLDEQADFTNVYNASGGMLSWINSNNKTIKAKLNFVSAFFYQSRNIITYKVRQCLQSFHN